MSDPPLIAAEGLVRVYGGRGARRIRALNDVTLAILPGESVAVVGESGSGKSTLVRCLVALERVDVGRVLWEGANVRSLSAAELRRRRQHVQVIFQDSLAAFNPRFTVAQVMREPLDNYVVQPSVSNGRDTASNDVYALLERVGLEPSLARRYPHELSGGQQQRVAIARALALRPKLLLCDEPLSSLDVSVQAQILTLLQDLRRQEGVSLLFVTHNLALVPYVSDRALVMQDGRIVEDLPSRRLEAAVNPYTRALLATVPDIDEPPRHAASSYLH